MKTRKEIEKFLIEIGIKIAKSGKGALFVIKEGELKYSNLFPQDISPFDIFKEPRRFELLAIQDGAMIIGLDGMLLSYCANIEKVKTIQNYGTRHSAGATASKNNTVILISEEDKKIRVFKRGRIIQEIDPYAKDIEKRTDEIVNFLESGDIVKGIGIGTIGVVAYNSSLPILTGLGMTAIQLIPGVLVFGSIAVLIKILIKHFRNNK